MTRIAIKSPSALLRQQVKNISSRMREIVGKKAVSPMGNATGFTEVKAHFAEVEKEAYLCCSVVDQAKSVESEDRAANATHAIMTTLVDIKNEAVEIVEAEKVGRKKFWRF
jgi:phosphoglycolate phosphatase-like HAD superfamily hydrolase